jgi:deazaflavin-dependent oxidoreductase (nitroreductase family)
MSQGTTKQGRPKGLLRFIMRAPIWLYRLRLGWLLGGRLLLLTHSGRVSSQPRQTVIEVVRHDQAADSYIIASGWGERADWYRNILKTPQVRLQVGRRQAAAVAERLPQDVAARELGDYACRHPVAFRNLSQLMIGEPLGGSAAECQRLAQVVPVVTLRVRAGIGGAQGLTGLR